MPDTHTNPDLTLVDALERKLTRIQSLADTLSSVDHPAELGTETIAHVAETTSQMWRKQSLRRAQIGTHTLPYRF